jgi:excisionase family DNA binding protein
MNVAPKHATGTHAANTASQADPERSVTVPPAGLCSPESGSNSHGPAQRPSGSPTTPSTSAAPKVEPECMRADALAEFLGVNRKTVYEYASRNVIPCRRLGRRLVFSRAAILAWLARQTPHVAAGGAR